MDATQEASFGALLKRYRIAAGLAQEVLAERAGLSAEAVSALERGWRRTPYRDTVRALADALGLTTEERAALEATVVRGRGPRSAGGRPAVPTSPLAVPLTSLIGREREAAAALHLLTRPGLRLLTLVGPGGVGKTRLAQRVVEDAAAGTAFPDGVRWVDLSPLREAGLVLPTLAVALGLSEQGATPVAEHLAAHLRARRLLLALDNMEQVAEAGPAVVALLAACPGIVALVTSRAALRVRGEQVVPVPPLALPEWPAGDRTPDLAALARTPAVALFVQRAQAVCPTFVLSAENAAAVASVCRRLDGLPLALELAAARLTLLSPQTLLSHLERGLAALGPGPRDLPERQRTLQATLDWSYGLLDPATQAVFRRLAVCVDGCTPDAALAVCRGEEEQADVLLDRLSALAEQSLVRVEDRSDGEPRLSLLETIRAYALAQVVTSGEMEALQQRHATYYLALADRAAPGLRGPDQGRWLACLMRERGNLRAALEWACAAPGRADMALRLAGALAPFWEIAGQLREGRIWLEQALALGEERASSSRAGGRAAVVTEARAVAGASALAWAQGDPRASRELGERALHLYRGVDDSAGMVVVITTVLVIGAVVRGEIALAEQLAQESQVHAQALGDPWSQARACEALAVVHAARGNLEVTAALRSESVRLFRLAGDTREVALALNRLAGLALRRQATAEVVQRSTEAQGLFEGLGDGGGAAEALFLRGRALHESGDLVTAADLYARSLALRQERGDFWGSTLAAFCLGLLLRERGVGLAGPGWDAARTVLTAVEDAAATMLAGGEGGQQRVAWWDEALSVTLNVRALLGAVAQDQGDGAEASAHYRAVLERALAVEATERPAIGIALALALRDVAARALAQGEAGRAACLAGAATAVQQAGIVGARDPLAIRLSVVSADEAACRRLEDNLRAVLGEEGLEAALDEGRARGARVAVCDALNGGDAAGRW